MTNDPPPGWTQVTLGGICKVEYGKGLSKSGRVESGGVEVYGSAGQVGHHDESLVDEPVVIVGRKGNAGAVWCTSGPSWPIDTTYFLRVPKGLSVKYLGLQLGHLDLVEQDSSTTIPSLRRPDLEAASVAIPPRVEQQRIVAAIEEHFSRLDTVEHDIKEAGGKGATLPSAVIPGLFSTDWPTRRIGELARVGSGATPKRSEVRYWSGGTIPWVTSGAINERAISSASGLVTKEALAETSVRLWPIGTVLVAMYGEGKTRGKAALLKIESTCNQACAAIDYDRSLVTGDYLLTYLNSQYEASRRLASGGVQPNLSLGLVKAMEIPIPSLETQRSVALQAEDIVLASEQLSETCTKARQHVTALRRSILAAAFSGQLVPQDPQDEHASLLLERIAASRSTKPNRRASARQVS